MPDDTRGGRTSYRYPWSFPPGERPGPVVATIVDDCSGTATGEAVWLLGVRIEGPSQDVRDRIEDGLAAFLARWTVEVEPAPPHTQPRDPGPCAICTETPPPCTALDPSVLS
jgi:hypothetical protein